MNARRGRSPGGLEREVVACLAAASAPMTAAEVQAALGGDLAYNTVLTALSRLFSKEVLRRSSRGRAFAYQLAGSGAEDADAAATAYRMRLLLEAGKDRTNVLSHFVGSLDKETESLLRAMLDESEREDNP